MYSKLLGFELKLHVRQVGTWVTLGIMFLLGMLIISTDAFNVSMAGERLKANGGIQVAGLAAAASIFSIFFGSVFVVSGFMRDSVHKMLELVHATPVKTRDLVLARMTGIYIATFLALAALLVGAFAGQFAPWMDKDNLTSINVWFFLQPMLVFLALNALIVSSLFTAVAAITRSRALVYVSAVALFALYTGSGMFLGEDANHLAIALSGPFGGRALGVTTEFWPAAESNSHVAPLLGLIGWNRLLWGGIAIALTVMNYRLFRRGLFSKGNSKAAADGETAELADLDLRPVKPDTGFGSALGVFWKRIKFEYLSSVRSVPFLILCAIAVLQFGLVIFFNTSFNPNPTIPTSATMSELVFSAAIIPMLIIMVFFSGDIIWRDRVAGISEIVDSTSAGNWPLMLGKWLALIGLVITPMLAGILLAMVVQIAMKGAPIHPFTYLQVMAGTFLPQIVLYSLLTLFIQNFLPNRVLGMLVAGGVLIFMLIFVGKLPFAHPLMEYGDVSAGRYSEINGFSNLIRFRWYLLYWGALAAFFVVASAWLWRRGQEAGLVQRFRKLGQKTSPVTITLAALSLLVFAGSGAWIYRATNVENEFLNKKQGEKRDVAWEKQFDALRKQTLPKIRKVDLDIDLHPKTRSGHIAGSFVIENTTGKPLTELWMQTPTDKASQMDMLALAGAKQVHDDKMKAILAKWPSYALFRFNTPLAPGADTTLEFAATQKPPSLSDSSPIRHNGTFVNNWQITPRLGVGDQRLRNPDVRRRNGLGKLELKPDQTDKAALQDNFITQYADYVDFKTRICTDEGQIPVAPGHMVQDDKGEKRDCRTYVASRPILDFASFLSADYTVKRDIWKNPNGPDVPLAVYYYKPHDYNVDRILAAMKDALSTYTSDFGPYQFKQMRILEFPYASFAQSFAGTIPFSENIGFVMDPGNPKDIKRIDLATYVTMHEVGHQWFAHQIVPADVKGYNVLSEGLTENAAMIAYEKKYGAEKARRVLDRRAIQGYLTGRVQDRRKEPLLRDATNQQYLIYNKASWVFWGLRHYLGTDKVVAAMDDLLAKFGQKGPPYPTTLDVIADLRAHAPQKYQQLISDYWNHITFWNFSIKPGAKMEKTADGKYNVTIKLKSDKLYASEEDGKETSVLKEKDGKLDEWVEIGFFAQKPKDSLGMVSQERKMLHITQPETELSFTLDEKPEYVMVDPRRLLIERNVKDNEQRLSLAGASREK